MTDPALQTVIDRILAVYGGWGPDTGVERMRADWEAFLAPKSDAKELKTFQANGVTVAWIGDVRPEDRSAVLFLHGGGFQVGSLNTHRALMSAISDGAGCPVLGIDYRLAPEHRFPAQLDDARRAYDWLLEQGFTAGRIALAGDSAGGGLAVSLMLALKADGMAMPAAAVLMSPWTDMEANGESYETRSEADPIHQRAMIKVLARTYLGRDANPRNPLASPLYGDLEGLPPLLVQVGGRETLLDDARILAERAEAAGVDASLEIWEDMIHVFQLYADELPDARSALATIGSFLRRHLGTG